ncbi:hypothetical protein BCS92_18270 [Vibrio tasmaniensis]|uniref:Uncharacterized protein n=1 Tax=Vibrio tasmaniensis TaxID=212663 RepID=A0A2N7NFS6_9VIBR|nr:hypothetical protein BCS92_18270 [Vibrio tasmaniensis]
MYEPTDGVVDFKLGSVVVIFQRRPKNHQCHRVDDGRFHVQWVVVVALDNEIFRAAFKGKEALAERLD